jgi:hypothetical protein
MSLRWLSGMVGGRARAGVRRKAAPQARRELFAEIDAAALGVRRLWLREVLREEQPRKMVVARVDAHERTEVLAWLSEAPTDPSSYKIRTDWIFLPAGPEAILMGVVKQIAGSFRFNLRFAADPYRQHLKTVARTGLLGLTTEVLRLGPDREILTPCLFVPVRSGPLRTFLRELPPAPVV